MVFVVNYIIHSNTCEQAYSGARNSGFSDYASPQVRYTAEYMPGFRYILHLTHSKGKAQQKIPSCMLAQRGQNYEHVHIISITHISFSYVQISVSIQIRRSREKNRQSRVQIRRSRVQIRRSGS
jgi:hypothetical protein